jgi:DNA processing protein
MDEPVDLVTLNLTPGVGPVVFRNLRSHFGSARAILEASEEEIRRVEGVSANVARAIVEGRGRGEEEMALAKEHGVRIVPHDSPEYPKSLLAIYDPPIVLYVRGTLQPSDLLALAIVGARRCSHYGSVQAERFAGALGRMGFTVVSGLAEGIDTAAHNGALKGGGRTFAVLGNGLCEIYPKRNEKLAAQIAEKGAILSEFPMRTRADARHFPQRNRVISGLSLGVMVVEASRQSGTLITAKWALEQGREVFALPGRVDSPTSFGTHGLIQKGAKLVTTPDDILEELGPLGELVKPAGAEEALSDPRELSLNSREKQVYQALSHEPMHIDEIARTTGLPVSTVMSTLTILEIKRLARQLAGKTFVKA